MHRAPTPLAINFFLIYVAKKTTLFKKKKLIRAYPRKSAAKNIHTLLK